MLKIISDTDTHDTQFCWETRFYRLGNFNVDVFGDDVRANRKTW